MKFNPVSINNFSGGLNDVGIPSKISDNEVADILNLEYDAVDSSLQTRYGTDIHSGTLFLEKNTVGGTKILSAYGYRRTGETYTRLIINIGTKLYGQNSAGGSFFDLLSGGPTITSNTVWHWVTFNDLLIGTNGDTVNTNPLKWDGTTTAAALSGTPPNGLYSAVWNGRVFMSVGDVLYYCKLGDPDDWTATGVSGAGNISFYKAGEDITGLAAHRERLFVFFRNSIWQIITANPNTDTSKWRVELFSRDGGCKAHETIRSFRNDLIFLSDDGVASLNALDTWGDFDRALLTKKINLPINQSRTDYVASVRPDLEQYWIALGSGADNDLVYVLDYSKDNQPRWTKFQFRMPSINAAPETDFGYFPVSAMVNLYDESGIPHFILGAGKTTGDTSYAGPAAEIVPWLQYPSVFGFRDGTSDFGIFGKDPDYEFRTKSYALDTPLIRKLINNFGVALKAFPTQTDMAIDVTYRFDQDPAQTKTLLLDYAGTIGDRKDLAEWRRVSGNPGRRFQEIDFTISRNSDYAPNSGFIFKELVLNAAPTNRRHIGDL